MTALLLEGIRFKGLPLEEVTELQPSPHTPQPCFRWHISRGKCILKSYFLLLSCQQDLTWVPHRQMRDSLTWLPPPSADLTLSCILTPHVFCSSQTCQPQRSPLNSPCPGAVCHHSPVPQCHHTTCSPTNSSAKCSLGASLFPAAWEKGSISRRSSLLLFWFSPSAAWPSAKAKWSK